MMDMRVAGFHEQEGSQSHYCIGMPPRLYWSWGTVSRELGGSKAIRNHPLSYRQLDVLNTEWRSHVQERR